MIFKPHDYQRYAMEFVKSHPISCLLLDMGLGKTVITLTALRELLFNSFESHKVLVIAPLRVARYSWPSEISKWAHTQCLTYSMVVGTADERIRALKTNADIYIINRENIKWLVQDSGVPFDFDTVVIDELSSFKNYNTERFKSLMLVRPKIKRIIGLTGTPTSNGLMDLFSQFRILDMGKRLGRFITHYRATYFEPDKRNGSVVYSYKLRDGADDEIYDKISDITISMKAIDHLNMPELFVNKVEVEMNKTELKYYKELKKELVLNLNGADITAASAGVLSNKLCQLASGAIYDDDKNIVRLHDRKLDALEDIIEGANGKPVLVAYWFKHDALRIKTRLEKLKVRFAFLDSDESLSAWNAGELDVALIHPASAGHGLNLQQGGSTLVWFSLTWSLELYQQTNARLWRQGQEHSVVIHHIVTKGTIDEQVIKALNNKNQTQTALIDAVKANLYN